MTKKQAAKLRGLIQAFTEDKLTLSHASKSEVHAGALDANLQMSREKMLKFIRELTDKSPPVVQDHYSDPVGTRDDAKAIYDPRCSGE